MLAIEGDHIMSLIAGFLVRYGEEELADLVTDKIINPKQLKTVPLVKKKLEKIIQQFVLQDKKLVAYYESNPQEQSEEQEQPEEVPKKRKRTASHSKQMKQELSEKSYKQVKAEEKSKGIYSKFSQAKLLETTVDKKIEMEEEEVSRKRKKSEGKSKVSVEKKPKKQVKSESEEQSSEEEIKSKPKPKAKPVEKEKPRRKVSKEVSKKADDSEESEEEQKPVAKPKYTKPAQKPQPQNNYPEDDYDNGEQKKPNKFFSRIDPSKIGPLPQNLRDNTYEAKMKFGDGGDDWGKFGNQKLKNERGEGFKKMKGKLKNKDFQGGKIDPFRVNSISLL